MSDPFIPDFVEQVDERPDFIEPDAPDHEWVTALEVDLADRVGIVEPSGDYYCQDPSITEMDSELAYILGYQTAIHRLRELTSKGLEVQLIEIEGHDFVADPSDSDGEDSGS